MGGGSFYNGKHVGVLRDLSLVAKLEATNVQKKCLFHDKFALPPRLNKCIVLAMSTVEELGQEIAELAVHLDAATHRLLECIRQFDAECAWEPQRAVSCAHWLSWRIGLDPATAREKVRVARALGKLPAIDAALKSGKLSYAKVRALTRVATPESEAKLLDAAMYSTGAQLERLCRGYRIAMTADNVLPPPERSVRWRDLPGGMVNLEVILSPDEADLVLAALDRAREVGRPDKADKTDVKAGPSAETPKRDWAHAKTSNDEPAAKTHWPSRADGVVALAESYLAGNVGRGSGGERFQVMLHIDQDPLAPDGVLAGTLEDGTPVSAEAIRRVACDAASWPSATTRLEQTCPLAGAPVRFPPPFGAPSSCATAVVPSPAAPTSVFCTVTTSSTGCMEALLASRTWPFYARTTIIWSTRVVGRSNERRMESYASVRRTGRKFQRYLRARRARMRSHSCTNGPKTAASTSAPIPTCHSGMAHGWTMTGQWRC
jgi:hypothetical protein